MPFDPTFWREFHDWIDQTAAAAPVRNQVKPCPKCGAPCRLIWGRCTKRWFWSHERLIGDQPRAHCVFMHLSRSILCETAEAAMAGEMFKAEEFVTDG